MDFVCTCTCRMMKKPTHFHSQLVKLFGFASSPCWRDRLSSCRVMFVSCAKLKVNMNILSPESPW